MKPYRVAAVKYETPFASVRKAVELAGGMKMFSPGSIVFIKPNIVFWTRQVPFPKWGVITTSRVIEDMIVLLKESGIDDITIGEGMVSLQSKDQETPAHAFRSLGYEIFRERYGVNYVNIMERPFEKVDLGEDITLRFNKDILESDLVVNLPVMKTHNQTVVSLGIKNLKGVIDIPSRKKCHSADAEKDLNWMVARLADPMPPVFTLIDGIFTNERGPGIDGRIQRSNLLAASTDILSADLVGASLLGYEGRKVPHLVHAAENRSRPLDLSDIEITGVNPENEAAYHDSTFQYTETEEGFQLPVPLAEMGIRGISYPKYDLSMCTYCSVINGVVLGAVRAAWKGDPWDRVEVLTGKRMFPSPGMNKTVLLGKCMYQKNKNHPNIKEMCAVRGCPPKPDDIVKAFHQAGIMVDPAIFKAIDQMPAMYLKHYQGKSEFDEGLFSAGHPSGGSR